MNAFCVFVIVFAVSGIVAEARSAEASHILVPDEAKVWRLSLVSVKSLLLVSSFSWIWLGYCHV